ncbi:MAG: zinc-dependent metalloprotease [Bacteroides sp.]|nr:zinc-dependent metalloprotease [Bacteroides sp.]MCM1447542.1 zinc-dependent metalloprotease [Bacteroides sp.]
MKKLFLLLMATALIGMPAEAKKKEKKKKGKAKTEAPAAPQKKEAKPSISRKGMLNVEKVGAEWFMEVPDSLIGKDILAVTRYTSTPSASGKFGGEECNEQVVYFQMNPDSTLLLRSRLTINLADSTDAISKAVNVCNEHPIIGAFKVEKHKDGMSRIKVTAFLNSDNPLGIMTFYKKSFTLGMQDMALSYVEDIKTFPTNTEIRLVKTYNSNGFSLPASAYTGKVTFGLNISLVMLPEEPMMPRLYDDRVGYFTHNFNKFSDQQQRVGYQRMISRYRLEPKNEEDAEKMRRGELIEPKKPIVYYIDPATPKQWRKYLIMGVNDWQAAFEQAGWKNAIRGEEWPENDSTMSMEDARFSMIRYLASPIANAYGPHISDPRTGEIMEAHVCWYHNVMSLVHDWYMVQASSIDEAARKMHYDEELMGNLIRFVSSHEVGHSLGLRHNFGSSAMVPTDSLRSKAFVDKYGHTPSIMDYARFNYVAQPEDGIDRKGIFPRIGDYDRWAIEWGYRAMPDAKTPLEDHKALEAMTSKAQKNHRLWWGDGEGLRGVDPRRQTEDLGDDAVKSSNYGILNLKREMKELTKWTYEDSDIYDENLEEMYSQMRGQYLRYAGHVASYIGGTYQTYNTRAQGGTTFQPTPLAKQKESLTWMEKNVLTEPVWMREFDYCKSLNRDTRNLTLPIARSGAYLLLNRLHGLNELYTSDKFINDMVRMCFSEATSGKSVSLYRQTLQNSLVDALANQFEAYSESTYRPERADYLLALKTIQSTIKNAGGDAKSRAHFQNLYDRIARALVIK